MPSDPHPLSFRRPRQWGSAAGRLGVGGLLVLSLILSTTRLNAQTDGPVLSDGEWTATFQAYGPITGGGFAGTITYGGQAEFSVAQGEIEGLWTMIGQSRYTGDCLVSTGDIAVDGTVKGDSGIPILRKVSMGGVGNVEMPCTNQTSSGPFIDPGGPIEFIVELTSATCPQVLGHFTIPANLAVSGAGAGSDLTAPFIATRTSAIRADVEGYQADMAALQEAWQDFVAALSEGTSTVMADLDGLLGQAEALARGLRGAHDCGLDPALGRFHNSLTTLMANLVRYALDHPEQFSTTDLDSIIQAAIRTGTIGSGALDQDTAAALEEELANELQRRLDESFDCFDAMAVQVGADMLGAGDVAADAAALVAVVCGGS